MEKKQGFFSVLKEEVARGLSPGKSRRSKAADSEAANRSGAGEVLSPLMEGPDPFTCEARAGERKEGWGKWVKGQLTRVPTSAAGTGDRRSDLRLLLGVMGAPLAPVHVCASEPLPHLSIKDTPIETSSAQYILQQYIAASGGQKLLSSLKSTYVMGKLTMTPTSFESGAKTVKISGSSPGSSGRFVLWQMEPEMWYVEMNLGGSKVHAGCNGEIVWRHTPWLGAHAAKGPVRPLRRALQGLDPLTTASMFASSRCIGERKINNEDCFVLKLCTDPETLKSRSEGLAEIIRHVMFGYFSQKTGLLIHLEDSHLTRVQSGSGTDAVYWETTMNSRIADYRTIEGVVVAHSGKSLVTLFRFGDSVSSHSKTRMEENWLIEEVAFNVPGLSVDCFIPPRDLKSAFSEGENRDLKNRDLESWDLKLGVVGNRAKVAHDGSKV